MKRIVFATSNSGKLKEAKVIAARFGISLLSPKELLEESRANNAVKPINDAPEVPENHPDYIGNAKAKAEAISEWGECFSIGDDSGLEVDALNGAPGLITARYAGTNATSEQNMSKLLGALSSDTERKARFRCVLYACLGEGISQSCEATLEGTIAKSPSGKGGFGYDPIFIPQGETLSLSALKEAGKEIKTHRVLAFEKLFAKLS